jgi:hypothetical protein
MCRSRSAGQRRSSDEHEIITGSVLHFSKSEPFARQAQAMSATTLIAACAALLTTAGVLFFLHMGMRMHPALPPES